MGKSLTQASLASEWQGWAEGTGSGLGLPGWKSWLYHLLASNPGEVAESLLLLVPCSAKRGSSSACLPG